MINEIYDIENHVHLYEHTSIIGWPKCACGKLYPEGLPKINVPSREELENEQ